LLQHFILGKPSFSCKLDCGKRSVTGAGKGRNTQKVLTTTQLGADRTFKESVKQGDHAIKTRDIHKIGQKAHSREPPDSDRVMTPRVA
jgi:hypothetical protein